MLLVVQSCDTSIINEIEQSLQVAAATKTISGRDECSQKNVVYHI